MVYSVIRTFFGQHFPDVNGLWESQILDQFVTLHKK